MKMTLWVKANQVITELARLADKVFNIGTHVELPIQRENLTNQRGE